MIKKKDISTAKKKDSSIIKKEFNNNKSTKISTIFITKMSDSYIDFESKQDAFKISKTEEYGIDEVKLQIVIEREGKKMFMSKTINIKPV